MRLGKEKKKIEEEANYSMKILDMWANAQRDGRPTEYW